MKQWLRNRGYPTTFKEICFCVYYYTSEPVKQLWGVHKNLLDLKTWMYAFLIVFMYALWFKKDYAFRVFVAIVILYFFQRPTDGEWRAEYKAKYLFKKP